MEPPSLVLSFSVSGLDTVELGAPPPSRLPSAHHLTVCSSLHQKDSHRLLPYEGQAARTCMLQSQRALDHGQSPS